MMPGSGTSDPELAEDGVITHYGGVTGVAGADGLTVDVHGWDTSAPVAMITITRIG